MIETCANCGHWRGVHHHVNEACPTRWDALREPVEWSKDAVFCAPPTEKDKPAHHSSEPWTVREQGEANQFAIITKEGWIIALLCNGELTVEQQRAIMRRMVACVNVCEGIPTEILENPGQKAACLASTRLVKALDGAFGRV